MHITVIGCGVSGLSTAIRLQEVGHAVQIWARDLPAANHLERRRSSLVSLQSLSRKPGAWLGAASYQAFDALLDEPDAGVMLVEGIELFPSAVDDPWWKSAVPSFRRAHADELPASARDGYVFAAHVIEMDVYLPYLQRRFLGAGGMIVQHELQTLDVALETTDIVVDCAGLGARELVGDTTLTPIRGQVLRVAQVGVERFTLDDHGWGGVTYIVPRRHDIILGGTAQEGDANCAPDAATAQAIFARCTAPRATFTWGKDT